MKCKILRTRYVSPEEQIDDKQEEMDDMSNIKDAVFIFRTHKHEERRS